MSLQPLQEREATSNMGLQGKFQRNRERFRAERALFARMDFREVSTKPELAQHLNRYKTASEEAVECTLVTFCFLRDMELNTSHLLYGYILDFYIPSLKMAIEIDGTSHVGRKEYDQKRDGHLAARGIYTARFNDGYAFRDQKAIIAAIESRARELSVDISVKQKPKGSSRFKRYAVPQKSGIRLAPDVVKWPNSM